MIIAIMRIEDFKALIYTIRNFYDAKLFNDMVVYPEALNNNRMLVKGSYSIRWQLFNYNHFRSFQQVLWPLSIFTATKKFNLRRAEAIKVQHAK